MSRPLPCLLLVGLLLPACSSELEYEGAFVLPSAGAITRPGQPTPFSETIAYVASRNGGQIRALGAESGRFLTDDPAATFWRGSPLPTGQRRVLTSVAIWTPTPDQVTVFAADQAYERLIEVLHVTGVEAGVPVEPTVSVSEVGVTGGGSVTELVVHDGFATTEDWTLTWDGAVWRAEGSRSGRLDGEIEPGQPYTPASQAFTVTTTAGTEVGDTLTFSTDSGVVEHDLGGVPIAVSTAPDQDLLAVILQDPETDTGTVVWWDPDSAAILAEVDLPEGRRPTGLAWGGDTLWIVDGTATVDDMTGEVVGGTLWSVPAGGTTPASVPLSAPASSIAPVPSADRLYYSVIGGSDLRAVRLSDGQTLDLDPVRPGSTRFPLHGVIRGMTLVPGTFTQLDDTDDEEPRSATDVIGISMLRGTVIFYDPATSCLLEDGLGPRTTAVGRTSATSAGDYSFDFDGIAGGPELARNEANNNHVVVNGCAGIARSESWRLTFDDVELAWRVEGELSGPQDSLAYEGVRYVSDNGAVSFLIEPGTAPSRGGWTIDFTVTDGVLGLTGDQDGDGIIDQLNNEFSWSAPGRPMALQLPAAGTRDAPVPAVVVPLEGNDRVVRGRPDTGQTDAVWQ